MHGATQPLFLLADSQLLFWQTDGALWLERVRQRLRPATDAQPHRAAYIGASNGDQPVFYELFVGAMAGIEIHDCRMIPSQPTAADHAYLAEADLVLLAGGDPQLGWAVFQANGLSDSIGACYMRGAVLLGISAGAMHLGRLGWSEHKPPAASSFATLGLLPYVVSAHAEPEWADLRAIIGGVAHEQHGLGIRTGGGAIYYPDGTLEAVRQPLDLFCATAQDVQQRMITPLT